MTKAWDTYEATIKTLYSQHTLTAVKKIMAERYGFRASTRAYRGRLNRWGVAKYKSKGRKIHGGQGNNPVSVEDGSARSCAASPILRRLDTTGQQSVSQPGFETRNISQQKNGGHQGYYGTSQYADSQERPQLNNRPYQVHDNTGAYWTATDRSSSNGTFSNTNNSQDGLRYPALNYSGISQYTTMSPHASNLIYPLYEGGESLFTSSVAAP